MSGSNQGDLTPMREEEEGVEDDNDAKPAAIDRQNAEEAQSRQAADQSLVTAQLPRRFRTAFILFSSFRHKLIRRELRESNRAVKTSQVSKQVGEEWRNLTAEERLYWDNQARQDKQRFESEMIAFRSVQLQAPKKPMSAFLAFSKDRRPPLRKIHKGLPNKDLAKLLSEEWHSLPSHEQDRYKQEYHARMKEYQRDMEPFRRKADTGETSYDSLQSLMDPHPVNLSGSSSLVPIAPYPGTQTTHQPIVQAPIATLSSSATTDNRDESVAPPDNGAREHGYQQKKALASLRESFQSALQDASKKTL